MANLSNNKNLNATNWAKGDKEGLFIDIRIISINAYFLSHQTDTKEDKASSKKLFGRLAYEHFKNNFNMCMMCQDVSVAMAV